MAVGAVAGLGDDLDALALEGAPQPLAQHRVVVDQDYRESHRCLLSSERRCTWISVPPRTDGRIESSAPMRAARSRIPMMP